MRQLSERIKKVRKDNKLSQKVFAEILGVHRGHISKIETGGASPSEQLIRSISTVFLINYWWLRDGIPPMQPRWVTDLRAAINASTDKDQIVTYRLVLKWSEYYHKLISCLGEEIYLLEDPSVKPGDPVIIEVMKKILKNLEGK